MKLINQMIVALYCRNKETMKFSDDKTILFFSKVTFVLPIFFYAIGLIDIISMYLFNSNIYIHNSKLFSLLYLLLFYFIVNPFTWKIEEVKLYAADEENQIIIKKAWWLWLSQLITAAIFGISFGY